jgi:hypothetical protein
VSDEQVCGRCGKVIEGCPGLGRDNKTILCHDCETDEAIIEYYGSEEAARKAFGAAGKKVGGKAE